MKHTHDHNTIINHLTQHVAVWQGAGFLMLICLVWINEIWDLPNAIYGQPPTPIDWLNASLFSSAIILVGGIIIAHTYLQQKNVLKGFVIVCAYCHKVHVEETKWEQLESYVSHRTLAEFSHGICPSCMDKAMTDIEESAPASPSS